jgi:hypothetical protein
VRLGGVWEGVVAEEEEESASWTGDWEWDSWTERDGRWVEVLSSGLKADWDGLDEGSGNGISD